MSDSQIITYEMDKILYKTVKIGRASCRERV